MTNDRLLNYIGLIVLGGLLAWMLTQGTTSALNMPKKVVIVKQADNGYIIERRVADNPYSVGERVALTPEQAAEEVKAYLTGPPVRPRYPELERVKK